MKNVLVKYDVRSLAAKKSRFVVVSINWLMTNDAMHVDGFRDAGHRDIPLKIAYRTFFFLEAFDMNSGSRLNCRQSVNRSTYMCLW